MAHPAVLRQRRSPSPTVTRAWVVVLALICLGLAVTTPLVTGGLAGLVAAVLVSGFRPLQLTALGDGRVKAEAMLRNFTIDLRPGFSLAETKLGKRALLLQIHGRSIRLNQFGTLAEVDAWLKEAQATRAPTFGTEAR